ncbi:MAG: hypothetical protein ACRCTE_13530 [Cellulosilyticaceae bacterium]
MINKKKNGCVILILTGILLAVVGLLLSAFATDGTVIARVASLGFGLGFGIIGGGIGALYKMNRLEKTPGKSKQMEIDYRDERNAMIRDKANAKAGEFSNWLVLLVAYLCIIMGYPTWLVLLILGVFLSKYILWIVLINRYNKTL